MGSCIKKPISPEPIEWEMNPLRFIEKLDDVCSICLGDFTSEFCYARCCNYFFHTKCIKEYHQYCKDNNKKVYCPICRTPTKLIV